VRHLHIWDEHPDFIRRGIQIEYDMANENFYT